MGPDGLYYLQRPQAFAENWKLSDDVNLLDRESGPPAVNLVRHVTIPQQNEKLTWSPDRRRVPQTGNSTDRRVNGIEELGVEVLMLNN